MEAYKMTSITALAVCLMACSAQAQTLDAANPVHCTVALTHFEQLAQLASDDASEFALQVRADWYGQRSSELPADARTSQVLEMVNDVLRSDAKEAAEFASECQRLQDEDADWQKFRAQRGQR